MFSLSSLLLLLTSTLVSTIHAQSNPTPKNISWDVGSPVNQFLDLTYVLPSLGTPGLTITWSNQTCTPTLCIKYLLRPIEDVTLWNSNQQHCISGAISLKTSTTIYPRMGLYHFMLDQTTCYGTFTIQGEFCSEVRVFDGRQCELTNKTALHTLSEKSLEPFILPPLAEEKYDLGHVTFIVNNPNMYTKNGNVKLNASGPLTITTRYGAVTRINPPFSITDYNESMSTGGEYTVTKPFKNVRYAPNDPRIYSTYNYISLMNRGTTNITVTSITSTMEICPGLKKGPTCVTPIPLGSSTNRFEYVTQSTWQYFEILKENYPKFTIRLQTIAQTDKLPDIYIRQNGYPTIDDDGDGTLIDNYDLYIDASNKGWIYYNAGTLDSNVNTIWYLGLHAKDGNVPPVLISIGQECPGDCSGSGKCVNYVCQCDPNFAGPTCGIQTTPSDEIILSDSARYTLLMIGLLTPLIGFFILRRHLRKIINRPSLASQGQGLGVGGPGHVLGGNDIQGGGDDRRWQ